MKANQTKFYQEEVVMITLKNNLNLEIENKVRGAIYGFIVGDAMGATTEFMDKERIAFEFKEYGGVKKIYGGGWLNLKKGEVTDDTQMMICVMKALHKEMNNVSKFKMEVAHNFSNWLKTNPKDVGNQCRLAICHYNQYGCYVPKDDEALGNGALMRAVPCALLDFLDLNLAQGEITHNSEGSSECIKMYHMEMQNYLRYNYSPDNGLSLRSPSGYVYDTLNNAMYWVEQTDNFRDAMFGAVNDGGDADTIAALTGGLAGAKYGFKDIPVDWVNTLDISVKYEVKKFIEFATNYLHDNGFVIQ